MLIRDASTPLTTAFAIQNNAGTSDLFSVASSGITMQDAAGNNALFFDSVNSELRVYENVATPSRYLKMYYDTANDVAVYGASSGAVQIGSGTGGGGDINFILNGAATDKLTGTKSFALAAAYSGTDFNYVRNLTGSTYAMTGNVFKIEDTSSFTSGSSSPNLLYINQNNTSATGNLILAQTGGATDRFKVSVAGDITSSGSLTLGTGSQSVTGGGALTVSSGSGTNLTMLAGGAGKVIAKPGTNSTSSFEVQNSSGTSVLGVNTTDNRISVGVSDTTGTLLVLDTKTDTGDPTGVNGGMYYNSNMNKFRCYENGAWANCLGYRSVVTLGSDVASTAATTFQDATGLSFTATSGVTYRFKATIAYTNSLTTIGSRWSVNGPKNSLLTYTADNTLDAATRTINNASAYDTGTTSTTSIAGTQYATIEGIVTPSATGTFIVRFAPETATASGVVVKAGSTLEWW